MRVRFHGGMHRCLHHACPERYQGRWICGLCVEAVKDEALRSVTHISTEEALERHISFCEKFRAWNPSDKTEHPIFAMGRILRRSLDSPRALRTKSSSVLPGHLLDLKVVSQLFLSDLFLLKFKFKSKSHSM
ncbi:uncharacterized protein LOC120156938 [Hibiscus syriacus]|uniref:uncharacterized protein LOC120156938 n=1 Tax=Hibiscus syriacus TaxID=106335 RepID=UPI0019213225|nr:uncharacterized protein LOC120156938 [Hibiscus syriacus]